MWALFLGQQIKVAYTHKCACIVFLYEENWLCRLMMLLLVSDVIFKSIGTFFVSWRALRFMCGRLCIRSCLKFYYVGAVATRKNGKSIMWSITSMTNASTRACMRACVRAHCSCLRIRTKDNENIYNE